MVQNGIETVLKNNPVIPVATIHNAEELETIVTKIQKAGINCIEITLRTEYAMEAIKQLKARNKSGFFVGVGTVIRPEQVEQVKELGVNFIVSPGLTEKLSIALAASGIPYIPGVSTVSEIMLGMEEKCAFFKFFPANLCGGIDALKAFGQLFPTVKFCPTGGINESTYESYLAEKNIISVGGSWMIK